MKLNGWQRIGAVAFAIWALVAFVGFWVDVHQGASSYYTHCSDIYKIWVDTDVPDRYERSQQCLKEAANYLDRNWKIATNDFWRYVSLVIAVPALLMWGLISLIIIIVRWIRRGFARS